MNIRLALIQPSRQVEIVDEEISGRRPFRVIDEQRYIAFVQ
jgi:hypothetical protein